MHLMLIPLVPLRINYEPLTNMHSQMPPAIDTDDMIQSALPFRVSPACHDDIPALVDIYFAAFRDDFGATTVSETLRQCWVTGLLGCMSNPSVRLLKSWKRIGDSEIIIGWAQLTPLRRLDDTNTRSCDSESDSDAVEEEEQEEQDEWEWASDEDQSDTTDREDIRMFSRLKTSLGQPSLEESWLNRNPPNTKRPLWHLDVIAVSPNYRHLGVESQLLEHILISADETHSEVCTEVRPVAAPLYRGFGFDDKGLIGSLHNSGLDRHLVMVRKPDLRQRLKIGVGQNYY